jgi:MFS family permease
MAGEAETRRDAARAHGAPQRFRAVLSGDRRLAALTAVNTIMYGLSAPIVVTVPFMLRQASGGASRATADAGAVAGVGVAGGAGPLTGLVFAAMVLGGLIGFAVASYAARRWRREGEMIRLALVLGAVALALVALSPAPSTLFIAGPLFGATAAIVHVGVITLVQRITPAGGRGRVFAAIEAFAAAAAPVGYVVGGLLGSVLLSRLQLVYASLALVVVLVFVVTFAALRTPRESGPQAGI